MSIPLAALKWLDTAINVLGEKFVVAALKTLVDNSKKAQLERNKEGFKRSYRRPKL
jgi:hypothetical protein